ncbi:hypothetical protein HDU67_001949, partial [Dinochytrium kinnereticum]
MIPGIKFQNIYADSFGKVAPSVAIGIEMAMRNNTVAIVGEYTSGNSMPLALALNSFKVILLSLLCSDILALRANITFQVYSCTAATSPALSDKSQYQYFFRTVPSSTRQAQSIARLIHSNGWAKVAVITVNNDYGLGLSQGFLSAAAKLNITILRNEAY